MKAKCRGNISPHNPFNRSAVEFTPCCAENYP